MDNIFHERNLFAHLRQGPKETVASFFTRLHEAVSKWKYDKPSEQIRDHITTQISDFKGNKKFQTKDLASLKPAYVLQTAKVAETFEDQMATQ